MDAPRTLPRIFIAIACYRDSECVHTLRSIFSQAKHPERIFVGVCDQYDDEQRLSRMVHELPQRRQVTIDEIHYTESEGSGYAWNRAHALSKGEMYSLQVHAHMRFMKDWDVQLIEQYEACPSERAFLTYYSPPYTPPDKLTPDWHAWRRVCTGSLGKKNDAQIIHLHRKIINAEDPRQGLYPSPYVVFNFIFAKTAFFQAMPFDPHIFFWGEEIAYSARLWTHGYDIYQLPTWLAYHQWFERDTSKTAEFFHLQHPKNIYSYARMGHLFGLPYAPQELDKDPLLDLAKYGMGAERALADWLSIAGVNLQKRTVAEAAKEGFWDVERMRPLYPKSEEARAETPTRARKKSSDMDVTSSQVANTGVNMLVCMTTHDTSALNMTLASLFHQADQPRNIQVSVAWTGEESWTMSESISAFSAQITIRAIGQGTALNAWNDALATWNQQPFIVLLRAGCTLARGWDDGVAQALISLGGHAMLTQIADRQPASATGAVRIALTPMRMGGEAVLVVNEAPERASRHPEEGTVLERTPVVCFDFIAGPATQWFTCLPDPYLPDSLQDIVFSTRLWTHQVEAFQTNVPLVYGNASQRPDPPLPGSSALLRMQYMLGMAYTEQGSVLFDLDKYGHGEHAGIDEFWELIGTDLAKQCIHPLAREGDWVRLAKRNTAKKMAERDPFFSPGAHDVGMSSHARIFVQIPSYRDKECQFTVKDLFEKATYPDRISVGICWQSIPEEDEDCFRIVTRPSQVRAVHFHATQSKGANWARVQAGKLRKDEEYVLMVDAHTRFVQGWDELLIHMLHMCPTRKAALSTYPTSYTLKGRVEDDHILRMCYKEFQKSAVPDVPLLKYKSERIGKEKWPDRPFMAATISSNCIFARRDFFDDVPLDPHIYFFGDDLDLMVRAWTSGWDVYSPHQPVLFHLWDRKTRPQHGNDNRNHRKLSDNTDKRVAHLTGMASVASGDPALAELDIYGLGSVRSLREFEVFSGVDFHARTLAGKALAGGPFVSVSPAVENMRQLADHVAIDGVGRTEQRKTDAAQIVHATLPAFSEQNEAEPRITPMIPSIHSRARERLHLASHIPGNHAPLKTYESSQMVVYDNFLPEHQYEKLHQFLVDADYRHINTTGNVNRVWALDNGFPLRSSWNYYYEALNQKKHPADETYPVHKPADQFIEQINRIAPEIEPIVGARGKDWAHYSVTSWLYPPNTGLSLHNDGAVYTGAYVYYINREWRLHWGGLLMVLDGMANQAIEAHKSEYNAQKFHRAKWLHESEHNEYAMEVGFARTVFPKRNRIVFIRPDAYHIVTKVLPAAGDNVRMTLAGFFNRGVLDKQHAKEKS